MKTTKWQLDMSNIPKEINKAVREAVLKILQENGYSDSYSNVLIHKFLIFGHGGKEDGNAIHWNSTAFQTQEYTVYDVMTQWEQWKQIKYAPPFEPVQVVLNPDYSAYVQEDGSVKVGCKTFSAESILAVAKAIRSVQKKKTAK